MIQSIRKNHKSVWKSDERCNKSMVVWGDPAKWAVCMLWTELPGDSPVKVLRIMSFKSIRGQWSCRTRIGACQGLKIHPPVPPVLLWHVLILHIVNFYMWNKTISRRVSCEKKNFYAFKKGKFNKKYERKEWCREAKVNLCQILWIFQFICPAWSHTWVGIEETG